jgi:hypothetical protein
VRVYDARGASITKPGAPISARATSECRCRRREARSKRAPVLLTCREGILTAKSDLLL